MQAFFGLRFHAVFYNSLKINALKKQGVSASAAPGSRGNFGNAYAATRFLIKSGKICNFVR